MNRFAFPLSVLLLLFARAAEAAQQGLVVQSDWKAADRCAMISGGSRDEESEGGR